MLVATKTSLYNRKSSVIKAFIFSICFSKIKRQLFEIRGGSIYREALILTNNFIGNTRKADYITDNLNIRPEYF